MPPDLPPPAAQNDLTPASDLGHRVVGGAIWSLAQTFGSKAAGIAAQLIVAAVLTKDDFGRFAEVIFIISLLGIVQQLGIAEILIRRHRRFHRWAESAFWMSMAGGILSAGLVVAVAPFAGMVFQGASHLQTLLLVASIGVPFDGMLLVPQAKLKSDLRFRTVALLGTAGVVATSILSVLFALSTKVWPQSPVGGAMSLILPRPIVSFVLLVLTLRLSGMRLRGRLSLHRWPSILRESRYFLCTSVFNTLLGQGDYLIVGMVFTAEQLGAYYFAFNLSTQTVQLISANMMSVLLPSFAKLEGDPARQRTAYIRVCSTLALVGTLGCLLQGILGGPLLHLAYGNKWDDAIPLFQILTVGMALMLPSVAGISMVQAQGAYRWFMGWTMVVTVSFIGAVLIGASTRSTVMIAVADAVFYAVFGPLGVVMPWRFAMPESVIALRRVYAFPVVAGATACAAAFGAAFISSPLPEWLRGTLAASAAVVVYASAAVMWRSEELRDLAGRIVPRFRRSSPETIG